MLNNISLLHFKTEQMTISDSFPVPSICEGIELIFEQEISISEPKVFSIIHTAPWNMTYIASEQYT
jgi:hypothetical protein